MRRLIILYMIILASVFLANNVGAESADDVYEVGVNDVLQIKVIDHRNLNTTTAVSSDGTITFPYLGMVYVKGKRISEIEDDITKKLSEGYINYPVVSVALYKSMSRKMFTYGEFAKRGVLSFEDNMTLLNVLSLAGGVSKDGLYGKLRVKREKKGKVGYEDIIEIDLNNGLIEDRKIRDMIIQPNDILIIERNKTFLIQGQVSTRGRLVLEKSTTVLRGLLQAGGVSKDGLYGTLKVRRKKKGKSDEYIDVVKSRLNEGVIEDKDVENLLLQPDDILLVEQNKTFLIQGEIAKRGRFILEKNTTVLRGLFQSGGVLKDGLNGSVIVRRKKQGKSDEYVTIVKSRLYDGVIEDSEVEDTLLQADDILIIYKNKTYFIQGEFVRRGRFVLEEDMSVIDALLIVGGVTDDGLYGKIRLRRKDSKTGEYKDIADAQLNNGVIENSEMENTALQPDDTLVVERNDSYFVYGEVFKPGEYILKNNVTAFDAIILTGGFTKWGSPKRVKILRKREDQSGIEILEVNIDKVIKGNSNADVILKSGDKIIVSAGGF